jgi:hypothetical protein
MIKNRTVSWLLLFGVCVCFGGGALAASEPPPEDGSGHILIWPQEKIVSLNDTFTLLIAIDTIDSVKGFRLDIEVDTNVIQLDSTRVTKDPFFNDPENGSFFFFKDTVYNFQDGDSSYVYEFLGAILGPGTYVSGPGTLVHIGFTAVGHGISPVMFRWAKLDGLDQQIPLSDSLHGLVIVCPTDETFGDCDNNGVVNIADVVFLIAYIFGGGPHPIPITLLGDVDCNGFVNISDAVYLIAWIFGGGPAPCNPCSK